jgi:hypothetical protein
MSGCTVESDRTSTAAFGPTASVAGIRTARKLSQGKLPSHRWSLTVEFDPKPPVSPTIIDADQQDCARP